MQVLIHFFWFKSFVTFEDSQIFCAFLQHFTYSTFQLLERVLIYYLLQK